MNHLVGLDVECPTKTLSASDAASLAAFRAAHEAAKPTDFDWEDDAAPTNAIANESSHEVDPSALPPCGWRPLDDSTLYRFLCADRRNGSFQPDKSSARLRRALSFRKEEGVDGILKCVDTEEEQKKGQQAQYDQTGDTKDEDRPRSAVISYERCDSLASLTSLASGTLSECGEKVQDITRTVGSQTRPARPPLPPKSNRSTANDDETESITNSSDTTAPPPPRRLCSNDLSRYQRLRVRVFVGRDHHGQPVLFERLGHFLGGGNCVHFTEQEWIALYIWDLERHFTEMRKASEESGKGITRFTYVADAEGIVAGIMNRNVWKVLPLLKALTKAVEEHYPEIADKIVLFNVPRIASVFYRAVRTFLDPVTAEKIELHSGIPTAEFERIMPKSVIPSEYGGTNDVHFPPAVTD